MFDESVGVIVKVSESESISAKIVKGQERPDLPCKVFLLGEQMCRPYVDEMFGLKSAGIRKPRDPEFAKKVAEAEKKKREKEEEQKKKRAEENELKIKDLAAMYNNQIKEWEKDCVQIRTTRDEYVKERIENYPEEEKEKARKEFNEAMGHLKEKEENNEVELGKALEERANLSRFSFGQRKKIDDIIAERMLIRQNIESKIGEEKKKYKDMLNEACVTNELKREFEKAAEDKYPMPEKPKEPEELRVYEEEKCREEIIKLFKDYPSNVFHYDDLQNKYLKQYNHILRKVLNEMVQEELLTEYNDIYCQY